MMYQFPIKKKMHIVIAHIVIARIVIAHIVIAHIVIAHLPSFDVPHGHQVPTNHLVDDDLVRSTKLPVVCQVLAKHHFYWVKHIFHWVTNTNSFFGNMSPGPSKASFLLGEIYQ